MWMKIDKPARCTECKRQCERAWYWFPKPGRWTIALCETCTKDTLEKNPPA